MPDKSPVIALQNPNFENAVELIRKALLERRTLIIVGNCQVDYVGRANSRLESGERIVIIKEDGSVLVHRPVGYEPVNWQPSGCIVQAQSLGEGLLVRAIRSKPRESVRMSFDRIYLLSSMNLVDRGEFSLHATEEDMQSAILLDPTILEPGLKLISYEKKVEPGFVDIYGIDRNGRLLIAEIKRRTAGQEAVLQLSKYVDSVRTMVSREVRGILVAPRLAKGTQRLLATLDLEYKHLDPKICSSILNSSKAKKLAEFFANNVETDSE